MAGGASRWFWCWWGCCNGAFYLPDPTNVPYYACKGISLTVPSCAAGTTQANVRGVRGVAEHPLV
jgi:hypothetical protein